MNNRRQQRFDKSVRDAVKAGLPKPRRPDGLSLDPATGVTSWEPPQDAGYGRQPTLAQARALADERALSDALAEALRGLLRAADHTRPEDWYRYRPVTLANQTLARYDAARGA